MPNEIERRFMIQKFSKKFPFPIDLPRLNIRQGYFELPVTDSSFRVRIIDNLEAILTIKDGKGVSRPEIESKTETLEFGEKAFSLCSYRLSKVRHVDGIWYIDFLNRPLDGIVLAEVNLQHEDEKFEMPNYIEEAIEVTNSLTSHHLARLVGELEGSGIPALPFLCGYVFSSIPRIVVTGGPGSGKSTIMDELRKRDDLRCVPEVATIVISQLNIKPKKQLNIKFQKFVHRTQRLFEATSIQYAILERKKGILFDRGTVDGAAYLEGGVKEFEDTVKTKLEHEYSQYDLIICLDVPPADVYEAKKNNNPARSEDYPTACVLGNRIKEVWRNHSNFVFIPNDGGWDEKVRKVKEAIDKVLR